MTFSNCKVEGCKKKSIFFTDYCLEHSPSQEFIISEIHKFIEKNKIVKGYNFSLVPFENMDFSGRDLSYSVFSRCNMRGVNFERTILISSFFDFGDLEKTNFLSSYLLFSVLGGANMKQADFDKADVNFCNFMGANLNEASFRESDLSYSRFISCNTKDTRFYNCNFKKTLFHNVFFNEDNLKTSNWQDAVMIDCKKENFGEINYQL